MELSEVNAKAKELYGPAAYARENRNGLFDILIALDDKNDLPYLLGWGHTWEDAFTLAETRAEWHGWLIEKSNTKPWRNSYFFFELLTR